MRCTLSRALECVAGGWEAQRSVVIHQRPKRLQEVRCWQLTHTHTRAVRTVLLAGPNCNCHCRRVCCRHLLCDGSVGLCKGGVGDPMGLTCEADSRAVCRQPRLNGGIAGPWGGVPMHLIRACGWPSACAFVVLRSTAALPRPAFPIPDLSHQSQSICINLIYGPIGAWVTPQRS